MPSSPLPPAPQDGETAQIHDIGFDLAWEDQGPLLTIRGDWTVWTIGGLEARIKTLTAPSKTGGLRIDAGALTRIDTAGALLLERILERLGRPDFDLIAGDQDLLRRLLAQARKTPLDVAEPEAPHWGLKQVLRRLGRGALEAKAETLQTLEFLGEATAALGRSVLNPKVLRWPAIVHSMEKAGLDALPILATLSFFIGMVIAYMGVNLLGQFGAEVFTVELVAVAVLREFGVVITAILLAGRTDSAFAAEIGAMKLNEEVDALKTLGLNPMDVLVTPRIIALLVMTPLLTFGAMVAGLAGGLLVLWVNLDMSPALTLARIENVVPAKHFWAGLAKAPVFGLILAVIGCRHGLAVERDVASLGARTTAAVVQAIFLVVLVDAIFAIVYLEVGI